MRTLYNILFTFFFWLASPYYFWRMWRRGNWIDGFMERFGVYNSSVKQALTNRDILWMHAVSVGEVNICTQLIRTLERRMPNLKIVVSTTTTTGMGELLKKLPTHVTKIYYPVDRRKYVARALSSNPPILLGDEPTGNLDSKTGAEILALMHDLRDRLGATIVIVTHDAGVAGSCQRTVTLKDARVVGDERRG